MRPPAFWARPAGAWAALLTPASWGWRLAGAARRATARPAPAPVPTICVGNLTVGGAGKTPLAVAVIEALADAGVAAHAVSRGYGGTERGPRRVAAADAAARVGDEPLLLAGFAPTWVARDRAAGVAAAAAAGAQAVVLDDGFQNPHVAKTLSLLAVDLGAGFGNGRVMPAGPLREPVAAGLARAHALVAVGEDDAAAAALAQAWPAPPTLRARLVPLRTGLSLAGEAVVAFAGIGRPEKFFDTLRGMGARLVAAHPFADHQPFAPRILRRLAAEAQAAQAMLVTTEKDAARLPAAFRHRVTAVPVRLRFDDPDALRRALDPAIVAALAVRPRRPRPAAP